MDLVKLREKLDEVARLQSELAKARVQVNDLLSDLKNDELTTQLRRATDLGFQTHMELGFAPTSGGSGYTSTPWTASH